MTAQWALQMAGYAEELPLSMVVGEVLDRFAEGAATADEVSDLAAFGDALREGPSAAEVEAQLRTLSHDGYLRGALVAMAAALSVRPDPNIALALSRELIDALAPDLGVRLARATVALPEVAQTRLQRDGPFVVGNLGLAEALLDGGDPAAALRHFEAVLAADIDHRRALRGWSTAVQTLQARGVQVEHRSRGLALLDGLADLEQSQAFGLQRYELGRPLGRGRHAVVYQAFDRHVGREVAIKRLLDPSARTDPTPRRVLETRFFAEARTLSRVRSPYVVSLLDARPRHRFIALELCRGGNLRLAMRRGLVGPGDLAPVYHQLRAALTAVHAAGAVHRDVKPANILVRDPKPQSPIALADFGLAIPAGPGAAPGHAGTLRYLAPELRRGGAKATPASDRFSAGVVLLELARAPLALPVEFDRIDADFDAAAHIPEDLPPADTGRLQRLLASDPEARSW